MPARMPTGKMRRFEDMTERTKRRRVSKVSRTQQKQLLAYLDRQIHDKPWKDTTLERKLRDVVLGEMLDKSEKGV